MDNYHIFNKIGLGKHSVVYKARKKKTIEYFAAKSVDKSQRLRVEQEVRTMHSLNHRNVLKFYAWFETRNHLWLILEYCVGGDLMSLLRQDKRLPEGSVHDFGRDLVVALQALHHSGIIYGDLKPSNILLDENGRLKLGGFGLSRRLGDIPLPDAGSDAASVLPMARRGTPCYMAPELFTDGAPQSTASDLWALGCVLYECAAGRPPFLDPSFNQLAHGILNDDPPPIPCATPEFAHLLSRLLDKNPATRIKWHELRAHPFWHSRFQELAMPPEPALERFIALYDLAGAAGSTLAAQAWSAPMRASVDVGRLSRIARHNLENEGEGCDYSPVLAEPGDITMDNADAELDFKEGGEEGAREDDHAGPRGEGSGAEDGAGACAAAPAAAPTPLGAARAMQGEEDKQQAQPHGPGRPQGAHDTDQGAGSARPAGMADAAATRSMPPPAGSGAAATAAAAAAAGRVAKRGDDAAGRPAASGAGGGRADVAGEARGGAHAAAAAAAGAGACGGGEVLRSSVESLVWHAADSAVKPIVGNKRIERLPDPTWDRRALPFAPMSLQEMLSCDQTQLEAFLAQIYRAAANGNTPTKDKLNVLAYFESLCGDTGAANVLVNSSLTELFVRMLRNGARTPLLRARVAGVLGMLVRHATFVSEELAKTGVVEALTEALRDKNERLRRRAMATLGELLFYIATQQQDSGGGSVAHVARVWGIGRATEEAVVRMLAGEDDAVALHYAAKTAENICSQPGEWASKFATREAMEALAGLMVSQPDAETLRATVASTLARVLHAAPPLAPLLLERLDVKTLAAGLSDPSGKVALGCLNCLNLALGGGHVEARHLAMLQAEGPLLASALVGALDHALPLMRAKAVVGALLLCRLLPHLLLELCQHKLMPPLERVARERDAYTQRAVAAFRAHAAAHALACCRGVQQVLSEATGDGVAALPDHRSASPRHLAPALRDFPVLLHLLPSRVLCSAVASRTLTQHLARLLTASSHPGLAAAGLVGLPDLRVALLHALEALLQHDELVLAQRQTMLEELVPALCAAVSRPSESTDVRFFCLRLVTDVLGLHLTRHAPPPAPAGAAAGVGATQALPGGDAGGSGGGAAHDAHGARDQGAAAAAGGGGGAWPPSDAPLRELLSRSVLPMVPALLDMSEPMPLYALKLLCVVLAAVPELVPDPQVKALAPQLFDFLSLEHANNNVHNMRLCRQLVAGGSCSVQQLADLEVGEKVAAVLEYAHTNSVEPFLEPVLDLLHALLALSAQALEADTAARPSAAAEAAAAAVPAPFTAHLPLLLDLAAGAQTGCGGPVSVHAAHCLALLVRLQPCGAAPWLVAGKHADVLEAMLLRGVPDGGEEGHPLLQQHLLQALAASFAGHGSAGAVAKRTAAAAVGRGLMEAVRRLEGSSDTAVAAAAAAAAGAFESWRASGGGPEDVPTA